MNHLNFQWLVAIFRHKIFQLNDFLRITVAAFFRALPIQKSNDLGKVCSCRQLSLIITC